MVIGFTGTRKGMSPTQRRQFRDVMDWLIAGCSARREPSVFHHGAAVGADIEAAAVVAELWPDVRIIPNPAGGDPLGRNKRIAMSSVLIAAPSGDREQLRSGTWATIRYARANNRPVVALSRGPS